MLALSAMMECRVKSAYRLEGPMSRENLDEKIVKKKSIPAQIVLWVVVIALLYLFYRALSGHPSH